MFVRRFVNREEVDDCEDKIDSCCVDSNAQLLYGATNAHDLQGRHHIKYAFGQWTQRNSTLYSHNM